MADDIAIRVDHVSKTFKLPHEKQNSIKGALISMIGGGRRSFERQEVLKDVSFEIKKGEFFGIVGRNGSGKSTLLKMLAGIYSTTEGSIVVDGKLTPFIELGVGFNPELTGRENVFLNGALLGFNHKDMDEMYDDIVSFAELNRFMDQKLKNYSSGMQVRLAFSIAIRAKSDILLIDEVLAVGDAAFQTKCFDYFQELIKSDTTVVFVSHDRASLERFCDRGVLINDGQVMKYGSIQSVLKDYSLIVLGELSKVKMSPEEAQPAKLAETASIYDTCTLDGNDVQVSKFSYGDPIKVQYKIDFKGKAVNPVIGITVWKKNTVDAIYATNTLLVENAHSGTFTAGDRLTFETILPAGLNDGEYFIEPALANESTTVFYDQVPKAARFFISGSNNPHSLINSSNTIVLTKS